MLAFRVSYSQILIKKLWELSRGLSLVANGSQRTKSGGKRYSVKPALAEDMDLDGRMQSKNIPQRNIVRLSASSIFPPRLSFSLYFVSQSIKKKKTHLFPSHPSFPLFHRQRAQTFTSTQASYKTLVHILYRKDHIQFYYCHFWHWS